MILLHPLLLSIMTLHLVGLSYASELIEELPPYHSPRQGTPGPWTELTGSYPRPKQYPPRTRRLITQVYVQYWSPDFILNKLLRTKQGSCRLFKYTWRLLLVIAARMKLLPPFRVSKFSEKLCYSYSNDPIGQTTVTLDWAPGTAPLILIINSRHWYPTLGNIHHIFHQYLHGW